MVTIDNLIFFSMKFLTVSFALIFLITLTACQTTTEDNTVADKNVSKAQTSRTVSIDTSMKEEKMQAFAATYTAYEADKAQGQKHILFFHAPWCPSCAKWEAMLEEKMGALADNVVIYKTDYDTSDDLKADYQITQQSTAVFVNADGSVAKREADPSIESMNEFFAN